MPYHTTCAALLSLLSLVACADDAKDSGSSSDVDAVPVVAPSDEQAVDVGDVVTFTISGLDPVQAYRVTLVSDANISVADGAGTFVDEDANGAADAGDSTATAAIVSVNGTGYDGAKTVPGGDDDPALPSGILPTSDGTITVEVEAVGAGAAWLVAYENGGSSTFLEIDDAGVPIEPHGVGGAIAVSSDGMPDVTPRYGRTISTGEAAAYTIVDLDDSQAYRVTLVVEDNISGDDIFTDDNADGAADAGASEEVALITMVNGEAIEGSKTWPAGSDDPASPSGIFPVSGKITIEVTGAGAGSVHPVAYDNGGGSTFLELGADSAPVERYGIGGALSVQ